MNTSPATEPVSTTAELNLVATICRGSPEECQQLAWEASSKVTLEMFDDVMAGTIWTIITDKLRTGEPISAETVCMACKQRGMHAATWTTFSQIMDRYLAPSMVPWLCDQVIENATKRALHLAAMEISEIGPGANSTEILARVEGMLYGRRWREDMVIGAKAFAKIGTDGLQNRWEAVQAGHPVGITTPFPKLNELTGGFNLGQLVIIGARPGVGKTALSVTLDVHFMERHKTMFVSAETGMESLFNRKVAVMLRIPATELRSGNISERTMAMLPGATGKIAACQGCYIDATAGINIDQLQANLHMAKRCYGIDIAFVDYLQKIRPSRHHEKRTYEVSQVSEGLQAVARRCNILIIALAQMTRESETRKGPPTLADLSDSSQIEKDADMILLLHRPKDERGFMSKEALLYVAKSRDGETGLIHLHFNAESTRFESAAIIDPRDIPQAR